jgi:glycosyltransferase involved in cell wall biosynthesis
MLGADVHVITMDLFPYHQTKDFAQTYSEFNHASELIADTEEKFEGYTLHVLRHEQVLGHMRMVGLSEKLRRLRPDVVQTMANFGWIAMDAAKLKPALGYKLFTGNHFHASVFPLAQRNGNQRWDKERIRCLLTRTIPGWMVSAVTEKCYAITSDCAKVATHFFGVPQKKIEICPLGVDSEFFQPALTASAREARRKLREELGFQPQDIVCVYSGRFSEDKNPLLLAKAVSDLMKRGECFRGLFVGNGAQAEAIRQLPGNVVLPFVPISVLGDYFRATDIGVWPTQESMSMLDAAACGLPIVVNHTVEAPERIEGNGIRYLLNNLEDLIRALLELRDPDLRRRLGDHGAQKMLRDFSWLNIARRRMHDYESALAPDREVEEKFVSEEKKLA